MSAPNKLAEMDGPAAPEQIRLTRRSPACYIRDPDGDIIEVGPSTNLADG